jgi:hypothetical protein
MKGEGHICETTGKRCYDSPRKARKATRKAGNRIRVYRCPACHHLHITGSAAER